MTVDRAALRKTLVDGWSPRMTVEIRVSVLRELLDELDAAVSIEQASRTLARLVERTAGQVREAEERARTAWSASWADDAEALAQELSSEHAARLRALVMRARGEL